MKVAIIGQPPFTGKAALELLKDKCDLGVVICSVMDKQLERIEELELTNQTHINELIKPLNKRLDKNLLQKYRGYDNKGSKYHK